ARIAYQYSERGELPVSARRYTATEDQRSLGGTDHRSTSSNPGNILNPLTSLPAYAIPSGQDGTSLTLADLIPGAANLENRNTGIDLLPDRKAHSLYLSASQRLGERVELYGDARANKMDTGLLIASEDRIFAVPQTNPFAANLPKGVLVGYNFRDDL